MDDLLHMTSTRVQMIESLYLWCLFRVSPYKWHRKCQFASTQVCKQDLFIQVCIYYRSQHNISWIILISIHGCQKKKKRKLGGYIWGATYLVPVGRYDLRIIDTVYLTLCKKLPIYLLADDAFIIILASMLEIVRGGGRTYILSNVTTTTTTYHL